MKKRVFIIVLDSLGIGTLPDANEFGDEGSNTLKSISSSEKFSIPNLKKWGIGNIEGVDFIPKSEAPLAAFGRMAEVSRGKDTTIGHWELCGVISPLPLPTYPDGFPKDLLEKIEEKIGRKFICNKPYSGTQVLSDFGEEHMKTGDLILYTSADSVFQIAAHEKVIPVHELYRYCEIAREELCGEHGVGRVIARPFIGEKGNFERTANRHDFSLAPPSKTLLDYAKGEGFSVISIGKIEDIFAGKGITKGYRTKDNRDGMKKILSVADDDFEGICFLNLVEFDSKYGHRNDVDGYAFALSEFDAFLPPLQEKMGEGDLLIVTADHGCDPGSESTDHSREYVPLLVYGTGVSPVDLGTRKTFADLAATVGEYLGIFPKNPGESFLSLLNPGGVL